MACSVVPVPSHQVAAHWEWVRPLLLRAMGRQEMGFSADDILGYLQARDMQLWIVPDKAMAITEIQVLPQHKTLAVAFMAGEEMETWFDLLLDELEAFGRAMGCKYAEECGRPGWKKVGRKRGWEPVYQIMRKAL